MGDNMKCIAAIDMGGTNIKYGVVNEKLELITASASPANSSDDKETLLNRLAEIIVLQKKIIKESGNEFCGIAVSTPGPFDYNAGKSGMKGKYDSIFGVDLRSEIRKRALLESNSPILFMQDAAAFLLGEFVAGSAKEEINCSCVTLGTGVGYACMLNREILLNPNGGPYYVFAFQKYKEELIENLISGRAIKKRFDADGKTLSERAFLGEEYALNAFYDMGKILGEGLLEIPETRKIDKLIIGGQVAYSFELMEKGIKAGLKEIGEKVKIERAVYPADAALLGVSYKLLNG